MTEFTQPLVIIPIYIMNEVIVKNYNSNYNQNLFSLSTIQTPF